MILEDIYTIDVRPFLHTHRLFIRGANFILPKFNRCFELYFQKQPPIREYNMYSMNFCTLLYDPLI